MAAEIRSKRRRIYRTLSPRVCRGCEYKELCLAELWGEDADYIRDAVYRKRERREEASTGEEGADA